MFVFHVIITIVIISCHHSEPGGGIGSIHCPGAERFTGTKSWGRPRSPAHQPFSCLAYLSLLTSRQHQAKQHLRTQFITCSAQDFIRICLAPFMVPRLRRNKLRSNLLSAPKILPTNWRLHPSSPSSTKMTIAEYARPQAPYL